ncbi:juvenile hormone esterase-like isoform X2 [Battus philenor]|uniref:juvenile hormone esterase-like isoform X2 n=1 Tax=Battus philenor TaxID=42288 RepID=UPI0035CF2600
MICTRAGYRAAWPSRRLARALTATMSTMHSPTVTTKQGSLRGMVDELYDGTPFYSFKGIPYAQPPVGKLRFKAPLKPLPWQGVYNAIEHGPTCPQLDLFTGQYQEGSEDCLFLNIYTKSLEGRTKAPVMVFIHGGAYMSGSGDADMYGPRLLLQHGVVLVTFNYRLELLGFLCLDTAEVPGNAGMKDQVAALQWVRDNIEQFGGDPNNVTLFGESAGATSVTYHTLSPMSTGLFHRAIAQSGVCVSAWARGTDGKQRAVRAARYLGKETEDPEELLEFLQSVPVHKFPGITFKTMTDDERHRGLPIHFAPVLEKRFDDTEVFLDVDPEELLSAKTFHRVPLVVGYNSAEGLMMAKNQVKKIDFINKHPSFLLPREIARSVTPAVLQALGERVKRFYAGAGDIREQDIDLLAKINSDVHFVYDCHKFRHLYGGAALMYRFDYDTELNVFKRTLGYEAHPGACHVDELFYLFDNAMNRDALAASAELRRAARAVTALWTDFAKTEATGAWAAAERGGCLHVPPRARPCCGERERVRFWNELHRTAGLPAIATSHL